MVWTEGFSNSHFSHIYTFAGYASMQLLLSALVLSNIYKRNKNDCLFFPPLRMSFFLQIILFIFSEGTGYRKEEDDMNAHGNMWTSSGNGSLDPSSLSLNENMTNLTVTSTPHIHGILSPLCLQESIHLYLKNIQRHGFHYHLRTNWF